MGCFSGPTTTTKSNQTQQSQQQQQGQSQSGSQYSNTVNPNLPDWLSQLYQNIPGMYQNPMSQLASQINTPLYGPQQQANFQQQLNRQLSQAGQNINSQLASQGALNSNRAGEAQTNLALGGAQELGNYLSQIPLLNRQAQSQALGQYGGLLNNLQGYRPPVIGQTSTGNQNQNQSYNSSGNASGTSQGTQTQQQSGGLLQGLLGSVLGGLGNLATGGLSGMLGGLFGGGGAQGMGSSAPQQISSDILNPGFSTMGGYGGPGSPGFPQAPTVNPFGGPYTGMGSMQYNPYNYFGVQ